MLSNRLNAKLGNLISEADTVRYKGEIFRMAGRNEMGERPLLGKGGEVVGKVNSDDSIDVYGEGDPESEHKKKNKKYIPKVTGWDVTWDDKLTGTRIGKFFPLDIGEHRASEFSRSLSSEGLGAQLKQVRGKSRWPSVLGHTSQ